jgi:hypothetical protein
MVHITNVEFITMLEDTTLLEIQHKKGCLRVPHTQNISYNKGVNIEEKTKFNAHEFQAYRNFTEEELLNFQNILLNAYVFSYDKLDNAIESKVSETSLNSLERKIRVLRAHLRYISSYLNEYETKLDKYKKV